MTVGRLETGSTTHVGTTGGHIGWVGNKHVLLWDADSQTNCLKGIDGRFCTELSRGVFGFVAW